jgi:hypothetical protein
MHWNDYTPPANQPAAVHPAVNGPASFAGNAPNPIRMPFDGTAARPGSIPPTISAPVSAALLGAVIGGANAFGRNLHQVQSGRMTLSQALVRGLLHGAATSVATTTAAVLTANVTESDLLRLTALAATTAGLSYLIAAGVPAVVRNRMEAET